jgi:hypothetical protein
MKPLQFRLTAFLVSAAMCAGTLVAKDRHRQQASVEPEDQILVNAHIPISRGPVTDFVVTQHHNRRYVYAQRGPTESPILIDITRIDAPKILSEPGQTGDAPSGDLVAVAGTAVLAADSQSAQKPSASRSLRIIDYAEPGHPRVVRRFDGVTAVKNDHGLILLANAEGIWILSQKLSEDPDEERRYANKVIYGESMY